MTMPEEVGKEIDLSEADLSTYGGFALDLDLDEDNYEDEDEDEDYFTQDDLAAVDEAIRTKLSGADLSGERQRLEWLRRGADDLSGSKIRADGFGKVPSTGTTRYPSKFQVRRSPHAQPFTLEAAQLSPRAHPHECRGQPKHPCITSHTHSAQPGPLPVPSMRARICPAPCTHRGGC